MSTTLNIVLPEEPRAFIESVCGEGKMHTTPNDFIVDLLRDKQLESQARGARQAIITGYQDAIAGRTVPFKGDLRKLLDEAQ